MTNYMQEIENIMDNNKDILQTDAEKIIYSEYFIMGKYLIACTETIRYRLGKKGKRGRDKIAYMVSCIDMAAKEGEQQGFCKRVGKKKDAMKYHFLLAIYCKNYGEGGLMRVWSEVEKYFDYKICINKDYTITPYVAMEYCKKDFKKKFGKYANQMEQL